MDPPIRSFFSPVKMIAFTIMRLRIISGWMFRTSMVLEIGIKSVIELRCLLKTKRGIHSKSFVMT